MCSLVHLKLLNINQKDQCKRFNFQFTLEKDKDVCAFLMHFWFLLVQGLQSLTHKPTAQIVSLEAERRKHPATIHFSVTTRPRTLKKH